MLLIEAQITNFKSIEDSGEVSIDAYVTVLVGQNESGKTAFLQALHKARPADKSVKYNVTEDYPRKSLNEYERSHASTPAIVAKLSYALQEHEINEINFNLGVEIIKELTFAINYALCGIV